MRAVRVAAVVMSLALGVGARPASVLHVPSADDAPAPTVEAESDLGAEALSILGAHCLPCHGPREGRGGKGGLRLDSIAGVRAGGEGGVAVVPGDGARGELFARIALPASDLDAMPPEGERLSPAEVDRLRAWVAADLPEPLPTSAAASRGAARTGRLRGLAEGLGPASQRDVEAARTAGAHVTSALPGTPLLEALFVVDRQAVDGRGLSALKPLAPWLVSVDLAGSASADADLSALAGASRLERLDLGRTAVGDAGVSALGSLPSLRSLVLFESRVTDATLDRLADEGAWPALADLYVAGSGVTGAGLARFSTVRPDVTVRAATLAELLGAAPAADDDALRVRRR